MKLVDLVAHVRTLTNDAPYAVIGGLAQILWARKSHTDDLDVAIAGSDFELARRRIQEGTAERWSEPKPPDSFEEANDVFRVCHALHDGCVVDLITFADRVFTSEIVASAREIPELGGARFIRPELLLVTQLLRPGPNAALAAIELVIARRSLGGMDEGDARRWAEHMGQGARFERVLAQADAMNSV